MEHAPDGPTSISDLMEHSSEMTDKVIAQYKRELAEAETTVNRVLGNMPPEMQQAFEELMSNKDGTYSHEQLAFLKKASKEGFIAATTYNATCRAIIDRMCEKNNPGGKSALNPTETDAGSR